MGANQKEIDGKCNEIIQIYLSQPEKCFTPSIQKYRSGKQSHGGIEN